MNKQAEKLCLLGATDADLADFFEVSVRTIERWKVVHEGFCRALKVAKEVADQRVERSLYQKAIGYETDAVKIFQYEGREVIVPYRERVQPETTAAIFWLKNRKPEKWRDRVDNTHSGADGGPIVIQDTDAARRVAFMLGRAVGSKEKEKQQSTES